MIYTPKTLDEVIGLWPHIEAHVRKATDQTDGTHEPIDVFRGIANGAYKLWVAMSEKTGGPVGITVTEIVVYPRQKRLRVFLVGGHSMDEWIDEMDAKTIAHAARA